MKWLTILLLVLFLLLVVMPAALLVAARLGDGPKGPIPGGPLRAGELHDGTAVDWSEVLGQQPVLEIEMQLESTGTSRVTGAFVDGGRLYVPCDLGYVWRRVPDGFSRLILRTIWVFKDWHERALEDGRVVIRVKDRRYALHAVRVTDDRLGSVFRERVSSAASDFFGGLLPVETDPADIWFFRLDPR